MKKTIKVKKDKKTGKTYLKLSDFKEMVDISLVKYYTLEVVNDDGHQCLIMKLYDKNKTLIEIKE